MKQLTPTKLFAVVVPKEAKEFELSDEYFFYTEPPIPFPAAIKLPEANWHILGEATAEGALFDLGKEAHQFMEIYEGTAPLEYRHIADTFRSLLSANGVELNGQKAVILKTI